VTLFALIPSAGGGTRFGGERPKQYLPLAGRPVIRHTVDRLVAGWPDARVFVILAADDTWYERCVGAIAGVTTLRCGGASRARTVRNALEMLAAEAKAEDWIAVHDAVRPCVDAESLLRLREAVADDGVGGLLAVPITSSIKRDDGADRVKRSESRTGLWHAQTPQMFRYGTLVEALRHDAGEATDEAMAIEALGHAPKLVMGSATNLKITYPADLALAEAVLAAHAGTRSASKEATPR
jgi:2-C-methyl-D-erythritol 4-phosphate cytidylyltransferase